MNSRVKEWQVMNGDARQRWIAILRNPDAYDRAEVFEALFKFYHAPMPGDEELIYPLLEYEDPWVAAQALYALCEVYDRRNELRDLIFQWSFGDPRDLMELPIQCEAIERLADLAVDGDREAYDRIWEIAEDPTIDEIPRERAWKCLAELHQVPWSDEYLDEMIDHPFSEASEEIRNRIREAIRQSGGWEALSRGKKKTDG